MLDATDWLPGEEIVIGPTEFTSAGFENVTIANVTGNIVFLATPLENFHYGSPKATATVDGSGLLNIGTGQSGGLDMRAGVGHLTRNIKIKGTTEDGLGGHI